ncbi:gamma-glutamyl-gamma-aminobutyrate hydrolase family protein [Phytohabitans sp. ZYX-F-186]|uniref:Gamma-glutamyl-gamma-aminobutyrate hydrolase family protein n=1 Tax=Phytohabitans maris TaxID=3071409 RepID=A0ABU0ZLP8_9ACTN|nr:gamma-glutamyl-gamma-aminobutyrate hydrolase family protein [Phytohabitans sp. ZYX-F-186]MDQ7907314.1 gamma-glutamyl-gamma-aminobutyrate hydrolase family protein [Phytohabitans sp. ZYX-F-186]
MRPIIGITSYVEPAAWGVWHDVPATLLPHSYVRAVEAAGGRAIVVPPDPSGAEILRVLDGLVLAGGPDVDPARYGTPADPRTDSPRRERDAGEFALVGADLPILGVCRGMQLLAVAYGGRLHQHLPDVLGHDKHRPAPGEYGSHGARFLPGSLVDRIMAGDGEVNSYHHQGVADAGRLTVTGWADDGTIEAVEDPARPFLLGVQWHPEVDGDARPFRALVEASR